MKPLLKILTKKQSLENWFFYLVVLANLIPVFSGKFFPTLDGPSHLYNAQLIQDIIFKNTEELNNVFALNPMLVPNWSGHLLLAFFLSFLPGYLAEKLFLVLYLIALPLAFRFLIQKVSSKNIQFSYFAFPLSYSSVFCLGFYNFSIALVFALLTLNYWLRHQTNYLSLKYNLVISSLLICTYFSHIFLFIIVIFFMAIYLISEALVQFINNENKLERILLPTLLKLRNMFIAAMIPMALMINFFINKPIKNAYVPVEMSKLIEWLFDFSAIISFADSFEKLYTRKIVYVLIFLIIIAIIQRIKGLRLKKEGNSQQPFKISLSRTIAFSDVWLVTTLMLLLMYFILPDSLSAGLVSTRIALLFFIFLIIWLAAQTYNKWILNISICLVLFCHFNLNNYYFEVSKQLNELAEECYDISNYIEEGSTVLPINNLDYLWLTGHYYGYFGANKPIILLENYECALGYFPIVWNLTGMPNYVIPDYKQTEGNCAKWKFDVLKNPTTIKNVVLMGKFEVEKDSCKQRLKMTLDKNYFLRFKSKNLQLYCIKDSIKFIIKDKAQKDL